jgi:glucose uptake protein GlcU
LEVAVSLVALLVDSDFAWELRNILLFFAAAAAAVAVNQSVSQKKSFISLVLGRL